MPGVRVWGQGVLAALLLLGLAACDGSRAADARLPARQPAIDPPQLWLVQVVGQKDGPAAAVFVCADAPLREAFVPARAEVNGRPCRDTTPPEAKASAWSLRCETKGRRFAVSASTVGDLAQDFRLNLALTPYFDPPGVQAVRQTRRFRRVGACPAGWKVGDQARPGHRPKKTRASGRLAQGAPAGGGPQRHPPVTGKSPSRA